MDKTIKLLKAFAYMYCSGVFLILFLYLVLFEIFEGMSTVREILDSKNLFTLIVVLFPGIFAGIIAQNIENMIAARRALDAARKAMYQD